MDGSHRIDTISILHSLPLFQNFSSSEVLLFYAVGTERGLPAGRVLGGGEGPIESLWVLLAGRLAVHSPLVPGHVSYLDAPAVYGVTALVPPHPDVRGVTHTDCQLLEIPVHTIRQFCADNPRLGHRLYESVARHLLDRLTTIVAEVRGARESGGV